MADMSNIMKMLNESVKAPEVKKQLLVENGKLAETRVLKESGLENSTETNQEGDNFESVIKAKRQDARGIIDKLKAKGFEVHWDEMDFKNAEVPLYVKYHSNDKADMDNFLREKGLELTEVEDDTLTEESKEDLENRLAQLSLTLEDNQLSEDELEAISNEIDEIERKLADKDFFRECGSNKTLKESRENDVEERVNKAKEWKQRVDKAVEAEELAEIVAEIVADTVSIKDINYAGEDLYNFIQGVMDDGDAYEQGPVTYVRSVKTNMQDMLDDFINNYPEAFEEESLDETAASDKADGMLKEETDLMNNSTYVSILNYIDSKIYDEDDKTRAAICRQLKNDLNIFGGLKESTNETLKEGAGHDIKAAEDIIKSVLDNTEDLSDEVRGMLEEALYKLSDKPNESTETSEEVDEEEIEVEGDLTECSHQGEIYMMTDGKKFFVGKNYNKDKNEMDEVKAYSLREEADADYLGRLEIHTGGEQNKPAMNQDKEATGKTINPTFTQELNESAVGEDFRNQIKQDLAQRFNDKWKKDYNGPFESINMSGDISDFDDYLNDKGFETEEESNDYAVFINEEQNTILTFENGTLTISSLDWEEDLDENVIDDLRVKYHLNKSNKAKTKEDEDKHFNKALNIANDADKKLRDKQTKMFAKGDAISNKARKMNTVKNVEKFGKEYFKNKKA